MSKIGIFSNTIFFDKTNFDKLDFIKICLRTFQIPSRNFNNLHDFETGSSYNHKLREKLKLNFRTVSKFKLFLYNQLKNYLPKSYLEDYKIFIKSNKKFLKKRLFIGSHSTTYFDRYKIF